MNGQRIICLLKRISDGKVAEYRDEHEWEDPEDAVYQWTEGNYGCDCNRQLFFARAAGEEEPRPKDLSCGEEQRFKLLSIVTESGAIIYVGDVS